MTAKYESAVEMIAYEAEQHADAMACMNGYLFGRLPWDHNEHTMFAEYIERTGGGWAGLRAWILARS